MTIPATTTSRYPLLGLYLRLTAVPFFWGGTFIAGRVISAELPPATAGCIRFIFATLALLIALHLTEGLSVLKRVTRAQWAGTFVLGLTGIMLYNICFFNALKYMPASRTSLFIALNPVVTLILAAVFFGDRITLTRWTGVALALVGVLVVVTHGDLTQLAGSFGAGELSMIVAVSAWAVYTLRGRKLLRELSPLLTTLLAALWGTLLLALCAIPELPRLHVEHFNLKVFAGLFYLGVFGTAVGFVWYYQGVSRIGAAKTVIFNNLVPVFGVLLGWLLLDEQLTPSLIVGGLLAITGVFLVNRP
ncbi:DMT family transporter [Aquirhabdus sp.]|uniref:DMT family transporter n=1 Tax=Aquirhabdus sp. TaxID=2824160 RepID=UPI00396C421B